MPSAKRWRGGERQRVVSEPLSGRSTGEVCASALTWTTRQRFWTSWIGQMLLPEVNILVYAYREDAPGHKRFRAWLQELVNGGTTL